jgi:hypothetical protein
MQPLFNFLNRPLHCYEFLNEETHDVKWDHLICQWLFNYPAGRIFGKISFRCIPNTCTVFKFTETTYEV